MTVDDDFYPDDDFPDESFPGDRLDNSDSDSDPEKAASTKFSSFDAWFETWLSAIVARKLSSSAGKNRVFCPRWFEHPEVVVRLHALWTAWEAASAAEDGAAMSAWWVHHADPQLRTMLDAEHGPMYLCSRDSHQKTPPIRLNLAQSPAGWFDELTG
ncbi:DUF4913 domain-containing protein [Rhodococcoides fascians]|uniref:DUF4913 domain-containing protein n=1 Tax=Rhodococcoides fascians TaxID=1828 RepID=UPI001C90A0A2|nr:DUF4913 domain-containing protein [Rhodococcus fascians]MBY4213384.1 DUF4913 domain-containing protein [Rhodococcus fascians]MBY4238334.1 DUF4913 domain-containing protein [Rhodococcus fascians]MBY4254285.1 DUF4913 domain-containing protein [Rhodococcus fascians]MBY4269666.1 DUF4913 domain-containing protein [Rhodococcus fascians]CAH0300073.1 hypothetical protein SRABI91_04512 [Rhodococcus fascians]